MALQKALQLLHAVEPVRLERILLQEQQSAHHVPRVNMALQAALQLPHALDFASLEHILQGGRQPAHHVPLVDMALQKALQLLHALDCASLEHILQGGLMAAHHVLRVDMDLQPALHLLHALEPVRLERILQGGHQSAYHVPLATMALQKALHLIHALDYAPLHRILQGGQQSAHYVPLATMAQPVSVQPQKQLLHAQDPVNKDIILLQDHKTAHPAKVGSVYSVGRGIRQIVHLLQWHSSPRPPTPFIYNATIDVPRLGTSFFSNHMYLYFVLRDIQTKYKYIPRKHILRRVQTPENNTKILCAGFGRRISNKSWWFAG
jgi:hypothetical protein